MRIEGTELMAEYFFSNRQIILRLAWPLFFCATSKKQTEAPWRLLSFKRSPVVCLWHRSYWNWHQLGSPFKQQKLKAWQPILTPRAVIISFLVIGIIFIPVGIVLLVASDSVIFLDVTQRRSPFLICSYSFSRLFKLNHQLMKSVRTAFQDKQLALLTLLLQT